MGNPLDNWVASKIRGTEESIPLSREEISSYQFKKIKETFAFAKSNSSFYKELYKKINLNDINSFEDIKKIPFINAQDIIENGMHMVTVRQDDIHRIVSLQTSGTSNKRKRIFFTKEDQELTIDYFHHGMMCLTTSSDVFLILLPTKTPGSVGDLLKIGMERLGAAVVPYGLVDNYEKVAKLIIEKGVTSLVGNPVQMLTLAEFAADKGFEIKLKSILLSTDYVPVSLSERLTDIWGCTVFEHYGMTEMGLGGGVFCNELCGYHMREADLYFEVVDNNGNTVSDGEYGELVFTTLTRTGMPLIRYKTGDYGRWLKKKCPCKSPLKLMEKVKNRINGAVVLPNNSKICISYIDEIIFSVRGVVDYDVVVLKDNTLNITLKLIGVNENKVIKEAENKLSKIAAIKNTKNNFKIKINCTYDIGEPVSALKKRKFITG